MRWIYWSGWLLFGAAARSLFGLKVIGRENLVQEGGVLVASNHQSFLDPPLIGSLYQNEIHFLARKTLFRGFGGWLYPRWNAVPVDQDRPDMGSLKTIIKLIKQGERVVVFPEGARTLDGSMGEGQPGIGLIAAKTGAVVQPIRLRGVDKVLPRGSAKVSLARITVSIGKPLRFTEEELKAASKSKEGYQTIANRIMQAIEAL